MHLQREYSRHRTDPRRKKDLKTGVPIHTETKTPAFRSVAGVRSSHPPRADNGNIRIMKKEKVCVSQLSQTSNSENFDPVITFYLELRWHIGHLLLRCSFWLRRTASVPAVRNLELLRPVLASGKAAFPFSIFSFFFDPFSLLDIFWCPVWDVLFFLHFRRFLVSFFLFGGKEIVPSAGVL